MSGISLTIFAPSVYAGAGAQTGMAYPLAIDAATAALTFVGAPWQPTVTNTNMVVHIAAGTVPTASGVTAVAAQTVTLGSAHATLPRIDRVVLDRVTGTASMVAGTPGASPTAPAVPAGKLPCCQMLVPAAAVAILNTNGTDDRAPWLLGLGSAAFEKLGGPVVDDGGGNLTVNASLLTAAGSVDLANDAVLIYSNAAGAPRKAAPNLLGGVSLAAFTALQQDVLQDYLYGAVNGAWAAGQCINGAFDAYNADTLSGVSGTSGQAYDGANKLYANKPADLLPSASVGSTVSMGAGNTIVSLAANNSMAATVGATVAAIGIYLLAPMTGVVAKLAKRNSAGNYDIVGQSAAYNHTGSGWEWVNLTTPYTVPAGASVYPGFYAPATVTSGITSTSGSPFDAYYVGNPTGTGITLTEESGTGRTYASAIRYQATNMTLVGAALNPAPTSAPAKVQMIALWKDLSGSAALNTDFTVEATENGGTNWVLGTLSDTGVTMAGGYHVLTATITLTSGGTTVQYRLKTLNNKSQQVKAVALMTQ